MSAALSMDLRERIVAAHEAGESCRVVARRFGVSHGVVHKLVCQHDEEGSLKPHTDRCGRKRAVSGASEDALRRHIREHPDATLEERRGALGLACSLKTVWESVRRLDGRFKKSLSGRPSKADRTLPALVVTGSLPSRRSTRNRLCSSTKQASRQT